MTGNIEIVFIWGQSNDVINLLSQDDLGQNNCTLFEWEHTEPGVIDKTQWR